MHYDITPLHVGTCWLGKDHVLGDDYSRDDRMEFALISFLIRGGGRNVLVDLGPKTVGYTNAMFIRWGILRRLHDGTEPDNVVQPEGDVLDGIARHGLAPEDISDVIFTHLHADHHGMDDATDGGACEDFPNAVFHISGAGWDYNVSRREDGHWNSYLDWGFGDSMLRKMDEARAVAHDNAIIAPGLETIYLGGHSPCSQAIRVQTSSGPVIIGGDDFYRYELLQQAVVARIYTTRERFLETNAMLADWALDGAAIIPVHDPTVLRLYREYGENWLGEAAKLSLEAAQGFRERVPSRPRAAG